MFSSPLVWLLALGLFFMAQNPAFTQSGSLAKLGGDPPYADNSVLANGKWVKIAITETGIYKIDFNLLQEMGFDVASLDPRQLAVFGNGGRMLPESNNAERIDDLFENAIMVKGENDGHFDVDDALYFYGESTMQWQWQNNRFVHQIHYYSDTNFYFLTVLDRQGKRVGARNEPAGLPQKETTHYLRHLVHERDLVNLILSGKEWYGEELTNSSPEAQFHFDFPDRQINRPVRFEVKMAGRSVSESFSFDVSANGVPIVVGASFIQLSPESTTYAWEVLRNLNFETTQSDIDIALKINAQQDNAKAWLAYLRLEAWCQLKYHPSQQLLFSNPELVMPNGVARFVVQGHSDAVHLWDVTNPLLPEAQPFAIENDDLTFKATSDSLRLYVMFEPGNTLTPLRFEHINNQNLHAIESADMLIVAPHMFLEYAHELVSAHYADDGLNSVVVNLDEIYNEFGSGKQDITAIRDFVRMVYRKSGGNLAYLLLFGDGSFDYKNRLENNTNIVPTYQASSSLTNSYSYVSDDYFGLLDPNEGLEMAGVLDIGIGRFPVNTQAEARVMVDKVKHYLERNSAKNGEWRNNILFMADDGDFNLHFNQAESLSNRVDTAYQNLNISKVYIDSFIRTTVPGGYLFPQANKTLLEKIDEGSLIVNYTGHGGINGLTDEKVFPVSAIENLSNYDKLSFFITATCEFSRFDNPGFVSAGERLLLNPKGGAIALMTTTRLAFAHSNFALNMKVYDNLFEPGKTRIRRLGDIIRLSKNPSGINIYNFVLLGDPALRPAYPQLRVMLDQFNNLNANAQPDTIGAMSQVKIEGRITDETGNPVDDFNGFLYAKMFDKKTVFKTLGNDPKSDVASFSFFEKLIYKGIVSVNEGRFEFEFPIPKDIAYQFGKAKLSFYACDTLNRRDAGGYYNNVILGGFDDEAVQDSQGPEITMILNEPGFEDGGYSIREPVVYIELHDPQGIHFLGNSIGRNIILRLEGPVSELFYLDNYFHPALDTYDKGSIVFPLGSLPDGHYKLTVKAWDLHNNSSERQLSFVIDPHARLSVNQIQNQPNPVNDYTDFVLQHNKAGQKLTIAIDIVNLSGMVVARIEKEMTADESHTLRLRWDGRSNSGGRLPGGIYLYRVTITDQDGDVFTASRKLMLTPSKE